MFVQRIAMEVKEFDLDGTLNCGQAFRWHPRAGGWDGVIGSRWVRLLQASPERLEAFAVGDPENWGWLRATLRLEDDLGERLATFPPDVALQEAVRACRGLRLLRQDPWECLASFVLSSTKQIVQIRRIIEMLCERFGIALEVAPGAREAWAFPTPERLAATNEGELRECRMGFRAPYLLEAARRVAEGHLDLEGLKQLPLAEARERLMALRGVGRKIADCALLFSCDQDGAFPVDVWVARALRRIYFPKRRPTRTRLLKFTETHFGPNAGLAQQYLFHHIRTTIQHEDAS